MDHSEFKIGLEFWCGGRQWRCTDVGSRLIIAIRVDSAEIGTAGTDETIRLSKAEAEAAGWFNGPPYGVAEAVFDEDDLEACSLVPDSDD